MIAWAFAIWVGGYPYHHAGSVTVPTLDVCLAVRDDILRMPSVSSDVLYVTSCAQVETDRDVDGQLPGTYTNMDGGQVTPMGM